ncbi:nuclear transport factor 2 family protein [Nocardia sp. bgisy134]|uniref:nuclear transport factor 2 family protein n=1 Tax=unclassified Nocardia TaxID=2637762 RepID=UPI003D74BAC6
MNIAEIYAADLRRREAQIRSDIEELSRLFDDDMLWIHASGQIDTKDTLLETLRSGKAKYLTIDTRDDSLRIKGGVAFLSGIVTIKAEMKGLERELEHRYTIAWHQHDGDLKVVNWQATRLDL